MRNSYYYVFHLNSGEYKGIKFGNIIGHKEFGKSIFKVDIVSFFTKIKDGTSELRIYQVGPRYINKRVVELENVIRTFEKEGDLTSTINAVQSLLEIDLVYLKIESNAI